MKNKMQNKSKEMKKKGCSCESNSYDESDCGTRTKDCAGGRRTK